MESFFKIITSPFLFLLSIPYRLAVSFRNFLYDIELLNAERFDIPIISVGNITVGGTGKTPHTEYLLTALSPHFKTAMLSRGYKRVTKGLVHATPSSSASEIGDEPRQILNKFPNTLVTVDGNRQRAIHSLTETHNDLDVIVLDDAYQHRKIEPAVNILLIDYNRPLKEDYSLPYGRLRESPNAKRRANIIIITKTPEDIKPIERRIVFKEYKLFPHQKLYFTSIQYKKIQQVYGKKAEVSIEDIQLNYKHIVLVTGIANTTNIKQYIESIGLSYHHLNYPDHHPFKESDLIRIEKTYSASPKETIVLTTEKDTVRLKETIKQTNFDGSFKDKTYCIYVGVHFLNENEEEFKNQIIDYVRKNKRNREVH